MHEYTKYFKSRKAYDRFIHQMYEKYKSLSKFSGTITLRNLSLEESIFLSRLFGKSYEEGSAIPLSISKFIQIMQLSKYSDFDMYTFMEEYLGIPLVTNKEERNTQISTEMHFYEEMIKSDSKGSQWLKDVIETKKSPYLLLHKKYNKNKNALQKELAFIIHFIDVLPKKKMLLPMYASMVTKDPHYLDLDTSHSNLYFYALAYVSGVDYPTSREEKIHLLSENNIEIDTISNYVITYNLFSDKEYLNAFSKNKETLLLNIQNIIKTNTFFSPNKKVFIFENPSLLTEILYCEMNVSVIISGGFPNTSVYLLLDKLLSSGNELYYNGDFDPEGLLIAQKLKEKYQEKIQFIGYTEEDYQSCISKNRLNESRLKKLTKIKEKDLFLMRDLLLKYKCAAYQENNKERILSLVLNKLGESKKE